MTRGSSRRVRGLVVKIKTKGGTIFEVDEKVARIFGKIRTEMTYNGTFTRSMSNQAVTRLHSPLPVHSFSSSSSTCSHLHHHQLLQQPSQNHCHCHHQDSMSSNQSQSSNGQLLSSKRDNGTSVSNVSRDKVPNVSRDKVSSVSRDSGQSCGLDQCNNRPDRRNENRPNCGEELAPEEVAAEELAPEEESKEDSGAICQCCSRQAQSVSSKTYNPRVPCDVDSNVILLDKTRGGIFALMLRWAKHHMNDPLIVYMERQEELRQMDGSVTHTGSSLFKSGRSHSLPSSSSGDKTSDSLPFSGDKTSDSLPSSSSADKTSLPSSADKTDLRLDDLPSWDSRFFSKLSRSQIYEMLHACSNLHVPLLTEMLAKTVADQMKGKSVEEVREEFGIVSDYTPEEEAALKEDYER